MKLYEIKHINDEYISNAHWGMNLKFIHSIDSFSGKIDKAEKQPEDWDHVKRLTHMLFLAWNDDNAIEGVVYVGELISSKPKDPNQEFYDFFKEVNGLVINDDQKELHRFFTTHKNGYVISPRRTGKTTYLSTLAIWMGRQGKNVQYITHNNDMGKWINKNFSCKNMVYPTSWQPKIGPVYSPDELIGYRIDYFLCDEISMFQNRTWEAIEDYTSVVKTCKEFGVYTKL